jgi:nucleotide-binding universal stress UspA family protein
MNRPDVATRIWFRKVLLATDLSKCSHAALPYAVSLANKYDSQLLVAHVVPQPPAESQAALEEMLDEAERSAIEAVRDFAAVLDGCPEVLIRSGNVWKELSEIIDTNRIDLVVIGTHGQGNCGKVDLGSTARQALRHAPCPVLTAGPDVSLDPTSRREIREVLYPADLEPETLAAAPYAISLACEYQAHLSLLHATERQNGTSSADFWTERLSDLIPWGGGLLHRPTAFVKYGPPVERILEAEHERGADLIVLGVKRTDRFSDEPTPLPWSGVERIVTEAHCAVLTIGS